MSQKKLFAQVGPMALLGLGLCGCLPYSSDPQEEQKEPHYLAGKARVNSLDFHGAIESFEKALEVNPRSASAHFELGWLFNDKEPDPAAAIYHYEKYLKLRPNADNAELVRQRINSCKQELAKAVMPLPVTPGLQREFEQLAEENKRLKEDLAKWQAFASSQSRAGTNVSGPVLYMARPGPVGAGGTQVSPPGSLGEMTSPERGSTGDAVPPSATRMRTHTVKAGDNPSTIARQYGVKLEALLAANPKLEPRKMQVGQTVIIP